MDRQIEAKESDIRCLTEQELDTIAAGAVHLGITSDSLVAHMSWGSNDFVVWANASTHGYCISNGGQQGTRRRTAAGRALPVIASAATEQPSSAAKFFRHSHSLPNPDSPAVVQVPGIMAV